jgi:glycosyltransferase involved in cell wall biosynthesis
MRVAIIHDWLVSYGGAERCLEVFHELFPEAPIFTSVYDPKKLPKSLSDIKVKTSFIQKLPMSITMYRNYLPFMPIAFESFNLHDYDLILSSSHACAKGVKTSKNTCHICYCYTPMRYAWDMFDEYMKIEHVGPLRRLVISFIMLFIRRWDWKNSKNVNYFIAISNFVADRIKKFYQRDSIVINPPVETKKFLPFDKTGEYYFVVSRLVPQKRVDIIIEAFNQLGLPLKIAGMGRDLNNLQKMAKSNIEFLGYQPDSVVADYMAGCKAFVFASKEDFGITPLEAQSAGRPVIVYNGGGAKETLIPGKTGILFDEQTSQSIINAVKKFQNMKFDGKEIREFALKFDREVFKKKISDYIQEKYGEYQRKIKDKR